MYMPGRKYTAATGYRYGFNGKENDAESGFQDYGMRIYDTRLGRFLSADPLIDNYPELTPYQFASDRPIDGIDLDGSEHYWYILDNDSKTGKTTLRTNGSQERELTLTDAFLFRNPTGDLIKTKQINVSIRKDGSIINAISFNYFKELFDWQANGYPNDPTEFQAKMEASQRQASSATLLLMGMTLEQIIDQGDGDYDGYANPGGQPRQTANSTTNKQATASKAAAKANTGDAVKNRVRLRKATLEKIKENQPTNSKGQMIDPNTKLPLIPGKIDIGHKPGQEWYKRKIMHQQQGSTRKEVIATENNPNLYHLEDMNSNRARTFEHKEN